MMLRDTMPETGIIKEADLGRMAIRFASQQLPCFLSGIPQRASVPLRTSSTCKHHVSKMSPGIYE